jgi:hypothetical protein
MGVIRTLVMLLVLAYGAWPYVDLWRLDRALRENDAAMLSALVDLQAIQARRTAVLERQIADAVPGRGPIPGMIREGARLATQGAVEPAVTLDWVRQTLRWRASAADAPYPSLIDRARFAFFDRLFWPDRFLVRVGELGEQPLHLRLALQDWKWRLSEVYE